MDKIWGVVHEIMYCLDELQYYVEDNPTKVAPVLFFVLLWLAMLVCSMAGAS